MVFRIQFNFLFLLPEHVGIGWIQFPLSLESFSTLVAATGRQSIMDLGDGTGWPRVSELVLNLIQFG